MNAPLRRGACPALSAPMQTGDGLIARLSPVGGSVSPTVLAGLCDAAAAHGNGILEVTARGNLQFRGLSADSAPMLAEAVNALGVAAQTGVPVETGPLGGLDPQETADPLPLAAAIRGAIAATDLPARLGPKVSVIVDGGGQITLDAIQADVRLTARYLAGRPSWHLAAGGTAETAEPIGFIKKNKEIDAVLSLLSAMGEQGRTAHARDLASEVLRSRLAAFVAHDDAPKAIARNCDPLGAFQMPGDRKVLGVGLAFGQTEAGDLRFFADAAADLGATALRFAPGRAILALGLSGPATIALRDRAAALGFITNGHDPRASIAACTGSPACASGHMPARTLAGQIARESAALLDGSVTLHLSGCAKGCAHPGKATLTIVGGAKECGFVAGGTPGTTPSAHVSAGDVPRAVARLARLYQANRQPEENAASCLTRLGVASVSESFAQGN